MIRVEDHSAHADEFRANLEKFRAACRAQLPQLSGINLAQNLPATASNLSPATPASGSASTVAVAQGNGPDNDLLTREMFVEGRMIGQGGNGKVNEFFSVPEWTMYAGKRVSYDANILCEIEMLKKLSHVSGPLACATRYARFLSPSLPCPHYCKLVSPPQIYDLPSSHSPQRRIVQYVDTIQESPSSNVLVMEYCGADTLWHQHRRQSLQEAEMLVVLRQSLDALVYLHSQGRVRTPHFGARPSPGQT